MYRLQGSQIQQEKKRNTLSEIMTPINKSTPNLLLGFDANQPKLFLESYFATQLAAAFLSKMVSFLDFYITQQAAMTNSLKILLPKSALACNIMSKGSRL